MCWRVDDVLMIVLMIVLMSVDVSVSLLMCWCVDDNHCVNVLIDVINT
jgi:hypothetical protein